MYSDASEEKWLFMSIRYQSQNYCSIPYFKKCGIPITMQREVLLLLIIIMKDVDFKRTFSLNSSESLLISPHAVNFDTDLFFVAFLCGSFQYLSGFTTIKQRLIVLQDMETTLQRTISCMECGIWGACEDFFLDNFQEAGLECSLLLAMPAAWLKWW